MCISYSCTATACSKLWQVFISRVWFTGMLRLANSFFSRKTNKGYLVDFNLALVGDAMQKKDSPWSGTKGFRAPEALVILRNMKVIAQLRGSEELWEVAKLHNRESSFPEELLRITVLKENGVEEMVRKHKTQTKPEATNQCRGPLEDKGSISSKRNRSLQWQWLLPQ
ncbi:hypothetical protein Bca4012_076335 [Brassica carinata]